MPTLCTLAAGAVLVALGTACFFWYRALGRLRSRDHLFRSILTLLAVRDFTDGNKLAATLDKAPDTAHLAAELRDTVAALMADEIDQQRNRHELEDVLSSLQDAVLVVDAESRLRFLNASALQWFNVRVEDVLGAQLLEALPSFGLETTVRAALHEGRASVNHVNLYAPQLRELLVRVAPVRSSDGRATGAVAIMQDLTEIRRLERVRRDFVANASHELRTPVATIRATAETVLASADDPAVAARFLPHLVSEAERLSRLVTDLLDLARTETQEEQPRHPVSLAAIARDVVQQLTSKASLQHIFVSFEGDHEGSVVGDAHGLEQVVFNLLDNAIMYSHAGGSIKLVLLPENAGEPGTVSLAVRDSGIGIPESDLPRVFERFYRVDKARSRAQGGTGLGLAIVKHIVENHGGHIRVESQVGQGTTFTVTLPAG